MTDTEETFSCTVESSDYNEADVFAWDRLCKYLGKGISRDTAKNWSLVRIDHAEHDEKPDTLVSTATFKRDGNDAPIERGGVAVEEPEEHSGD